MPIHHRIPGIIAQAISKGRPIFVADKMVLNKAYTGFKHKSSIVSGIRHGLVAGSVAGGFIRDSDNPEMDAQVPFFNGSSPSSSNKTRYRRRGKCNRYDKFGNRLNCNSRRSNSYKSNRMRYR